MAGNQILITQVINKHSQNINKSVRCAHHDTNNGS